MITIFDHTDLIINSENFIKTASYDFDLADIDIIAWLISYNFLSGAIMIYKIGCIYGEHFGFSLTTNKLKRGNLHFKKVLKSENFKIKTPMGEVCNMYLFGPLAKQKPVSLFSYFDVQRICLRGLQYYIKWKPPTLYFVFMKCSKYPKSGHFWISDK